MTSTFEVRIIIAIKSIYFSHFNFIVRVLNIFQGFLDIHKSICIYPAPPSQVECDTRSIFIQSKASLSLKFFFS